jgi:hypothetical protein
MRISHHTHRFLIVIALTTCASTGHGAAVNDARPVSVLMQESPSVTITNGLIDATVAPPDPKAGFYRGTRFDWSGMITKLCYGGQRFYGPWFDQVSPSVRDFAYDGDTLIASTASAATGPAEEFDPADNPLGYDAAKSGDSFIKIGVGVLRRPDLSEYDHYRAYEILDHGQWHFQKNGRGSVIFTQQLKDLRSGYAYNYVKRIDLVPGSPRMIISHTLTNRGKLTISSSLYDHNFLTLDGNPTQTGLTLEVPFAIRSDVAAADATLAGNRVTLARSPPPHESIAFFVTGFGPTAADYRFAVSSADQRATVSVSGDTPIAKVQFWSIPRVVAAEPYIHIDVPAGQSIRWRYVYDYRAKAGAAAGCTD